VAEYDSIAWHSDPVAMLHDRMRTARLQECGWTVIPIVVHDIYRDRIAFLARMRRHLDRAA
jgi:very-short-patch-repair endonuclease